MRALVHYIAMQCHIDDLLLDPFVGALAPYVDAIFIGILIALFVWRLMSPLIRAFAWKPIPLDEDEGGEGPMTGPDEDLIHIEPMSELAVALSRAETQNAAKDVEIATLQNLIEQSALHIFPTTRRKSKTAKKSPDVPVSTSGGGRNVYVSNILIIFVVCPMVFLAGVKCLPCAGRRHYVAHIQ